MVFAIRPWLTFGDPASIRGTNNIMRKEKTLILAHYPDLNERLNGFDLVIFGFS